MGSMQGWSVFTGALPYVTLACIIRCTINLPLPLISPSAHPRSFAKPPVWVCLLYCVPVYPASPAVSAAWSCTASRSMPKTPPKLSQTRVAKLGDPPGYRCHHLSGVCATRGTRLEILPYPWCLTDMKLQKRFSRKRVVNINIFPKNQTENTGRWEVN